MHDFDKLELSTETIRELNADEMAQVAGGADTVEVGNTKFCHLFPTYQCTGMYPTFDGCTNR